MSGVRGQPEGAANGKLASTEASARVSVGSRARHDAYGAAPVNRPVLSLQGESTSPAALWRSLWRSRELLAILARKEFQVRYRRASLGLLWAVGLPLLQSLVMAVVFSKVAHIRAAPHYAVFVLAGMTAFITFSAALGPGSTAIVDGSDLSSRVYFPRLLLPMMQVATNLYGYVITLAILLALCPVLHVALGLRTLLLIPATVLLVAVTAGFCLLSSALHVYFRDMRYMVAAALMLWMYVTPIIYPPGDVPGLLRGVLDANPMTGVVDLFHVATVGYGGPSELTMVVSVAWALGLLVVATAVHCRFDRVFADLL